MVNKEIIGIIFLIVLGLIILIFKPVRLLAGLTFITKEEKEKINTEKICKYAAIFLFCYAGYFTFFYFVEINVLIRFIVLISTLIYFLVEVNSKKIFRWIYRTYKRLAW